MPLNYYQTLITVADDCPVRESVVPKKRGDELTVAVFQYELISANPYVYTQEDVLFQTWLKRQDELRNLSEEDITQMRKEFFAKPQPCLRTSPLPRKYGWGLLFDREGRVVLCPMESAEYQNGLSGKNGEIKVLKAFRSKRG